MSGVSRPGEAWLVPWLGLLSLVAAVATLQVMLFPSWPRVEELPLASLQGALRRAGFDARPLPFRPARRSSERVLSRQLGWSLADGSQLWLLHGAVRRYENLQPAVLARGNPLLLLPSPRRDHPSRGSASGSIAGHPAVQTCLVPQPSGPAIAAVTRNGLLKASDPRRSVADLLHRGNGLATLQTLLRPRSFACVLVTLRSGSGRPLPAGLWSRLLPAIQSGLSDQGRG